MNKLQENELRQMIRQMIESELEEDLIPREKEPSSYQKFFKKALEKFGVNSPEELSDARKKEFFDYVDKNWDAGENETDLDEMSGSANAGPYMTPGAFTRDTQDYENSPASNAMKDWKKTKRIDEINFKDGRMLTEMAVAQIKPLIGKEAAFKYKKASGETKTYFGRLVKINGDKLYAGILHKGLRNFLIANIVSISPANFSESQIKQLDKMITEHKKNEIKEQVDFKDENFSPRQKMAQAVRGMREQLKEVEKLVDKASIFKEENGMKSAEMYKRTHGALRKINEITIRIMNKLNKIK